MKKFFALLLSLVLALSLLPAAVLAEEDVPVLISAPAAELTVTDAEGKTVAEGKDTWYLADGVLHIAGDDYTLSGDSAYPLLAEETVETLTLAGVYLNTAAETEDSLVGIRLCGGVLLKLKGSNTVMMPTAEDLGSAAKKSFAILAEELSIEAEEGASLRLNASAADESAALMVRESLSITGGSYSFTASETKYGESCAAKSGNTTVFTDCKIFLNAGTGIVTERYLWTSGSTVDAFVSDAALKADEVMSAGLTLRFSLRKNGDQPTGIETRSFYLGAATVLGAPTCPSLKVSEPIVHAFAPEAVTKLVCDGKILGSFDEENELSFIGAEWTGNGYQPAGDGPMTVIGLPQVHTYKEWKEDSFDYLDDPVAGDEVRELPFYTVFWTNFETAPKLKLAWLDKHPGITLKLKDDMIYLSVSKWAKAGEYDFRLYANDVYCDTTLTVLPDLSFADIRIGETFYNDIAFCTEKGLMENRSGSAFAPKENARRQELWRALACMAGESPADMDEAQQWAVKNGISDGTAPTAQLSRQQLAAMLYRYAKLQGKGFTGAWMFLLDAPDRSAIGGYAYEAMCWCSMKGILAGDSEGMLRPLAPASRGSVAAALHRFARTLEN